jgi:FkbM family methyltransferase
MGGLTKTVLALAVLAAAGVAAGRYYPPLRLFAFKAAGRSPVCPLDHALKANENEKLQLQYKDRILYASKLIEKDPAGFHLWDTPHGRWWIPQGDDFMLPFNLAEQQRQIYGTGDQTVQPGDIVLDCGANVGVFTRVALDAGAAKVVAIEPAPENLESLRRNFPKEIAAGHVVVYPKGVWNKDDVLTLRRDPNNTAADSFVMLKDKKESSIQVPLTTIDKLVDELKLERVSYIKMDIEGAETNALAGARATLAKYHPRLSLASYHIPTDAQRIPEVVRQAWPEAVMEVGPCAETPDGHVRPDVLYFH